MRAIRFAPAVAVGLAVALLAPTSAGAQQSPVGPAPDPVGLAGESFTPSSKTVRLEDGTSRTTLYGGTAFRRLPGRGWERTSGKVEDTADPNLPAAASGTYRPVRFGNNPRRLLQLDLDGGPVALSSRDLAVVKPVRDGSTVRYPAVATDTDLEFEVSPNGVKENFILKSPRAPRSFTYHLSDPTRQLGDVARGNSGAAASRSGAKFSKADSDGVGLVIPPAVAFELPQGDALPDLRENSAHLDVVPARDGYDITVRLDEQWLVGKSFPIVLDPSIVFAENVGPAGAADCWVQDGTHATTPMCQNSNVTGRNEGETARSLVRFDTSKLVETGGSKINSATLQMYQTGNVCGTTPTSPACAQNTLVGAVPAGSGGTWQWQENATWFRYDSAGEPAKSWASVGVPDSGWPGSAIGQWAGVVAAGNQGYRSLTGAAGSGLVNTIQGWADNPASNRGFSLRGPETTSAYQFTKYSTTEKETAFWPTLTVDYTPRPTVPQTVSAVAGNAEARVKFSAPANASGTTNVAQVSSYTIRSQSPDGGATPTATCTAGTTDCPSGTGGAGFLLGGLTNGKKYTFTVTATGPGGTSDPATTPPGVTYTPTAPDTAGPAGPAISSSSHPTPGTWYSVGDLALAWTAPADPSGISGYSYALDTSPGTEPTTNVTPDPRTSITYPNTPTGDYYFHIRARDGAGNWGASSHYRLLVDLTAPAPATRPAETADLRTGQPYQGGDRPLFLASNDRTITMRWNAGDTDAQSGPGGYSYQFTNSSEFLPDTVRDTDADQGTVTSRTLPDGVWYFHVVALDQAKASSGNVQANRSTALTSGPYLIGEATLADALLSGTTAGSDELGLEQFAPYASQPLGNGTAYIHLRTGNVVTQQDLFTIPGQGLNTVARITHNSQAGGRDSGVGAGWNLSVTDLEGGIEGPLEDLTDGAVTDIDINRDVTLAAITTDSQTAVKRLSQDTIDDANAAQGKLLEFVDGDGTTHRFVREAGAGGRWVSPPGVDLKIHEYLNTTGQADRYELVRPDGVTYTATKLAFQGQKALALPVWRVTKVTDRSGNTLTYDHDNFSPEGINKTRLIRITQNRADGDRIAAEFTYEPFTTDSALKDNAGVLRTITTLPSQAGQRRWQLEITDSNLISGGGHDLLSITEAADATVATTSGPTIAGTSNATGMTVEQAAASGRRTTRYSYSAEDRTLATVTDPNGTRTLLRYLPGKPIGSATGDRTVPMLESLTDRAGAVTRFAYAAAPQGGGVTRTTVTRPAGAAGEGANTADYDISARGPVNPNGDPRTAGGNIIKTVDAGTVSPSGALLRVVTRHDWYANKLVRTRDADGAATSFRYNDLGLLLQVTHPAPNKTGAAALDGDRTPTGRITNTLAYRYAPEPRFSYLASSCTPAADTAAENPAAAESEFQPSRQVSPAGNCASVAELTRVTTAANISGQQRLADFAYDTAGRLTDVLERSDNQPAAGSPARATDRLTRFAYYSRGGLKQIDGPRTDVTDVTRYGQFADTTSPADPAYGGADRSGQPVTLRDAAGKTKTFTYSPYGMVTAVTDRDGRTTTSRYDERDNLIAATVPGGATTTYAYDSTDNKRFEVQPARTSGSGSSAPTTETVYDAMDRQVRLLTPGADESAASPVKTVTETSYNPDGTTRSVDGPLAAGDVTTYEYYANRMPKRTISPASGGAGSASTADSVTFYDAVGRAVRTLGPVVDAAGNRTVETTSYTPSGEAQTTATTSTTGSGNGTAGNTDRTVEMAYNAHGEAVRTFAPTLAAGAGKRGVETTTFDAFGQPTGKSRLLDAPGGDKQVLSATGYDLAGNATRQTQATAQGQQLETLYRFDALNRLAEQTKDPVNPNHRIRYAYSGESQQTLRRDVTVASGTEQTLRTAETLYNDDNTKRAEIITTTDPRTPAAERVLATCNTRADGTSGYDSTGNLLTTRTIRGPTRTDGCALTDGAVLLREQTMRYDDRDWLTTSTMAVRSPQTGTMISRQQRMTYHPNGSKASVTHDEDTDTTQQYKADYAITPAGWETSVTDWRGRTSELTYLPNGSVTRQVLGKGGAQPTGVATANSTYKVDGTLASLAWTTGGPDNPGTTVRAHTDITYDNRGLRVAETVSVRQPGKTTSDTGTASYSYDLLDRLTRYTSPHPYDDAERRRATTTYTLDDGGNTLRELTTVADAGGANARTLGDITNTYNNGRLTRRVAKQTIADAASQLDLITTDETLTYNDLGEETKRTGTDKYVGTDLPVPLIDTTSTTETRYDAAGHNGQVANTATKPVGTPQTDLDKANADVDYDYDTTDRVISRRETKGSGATAITSTTLYFYAGTSGSLIEETDGTGKTKTRYLLDGDGESIAQQTYKTTTTGTTGGISTETGEKWSWLLNDALGNTATTLDDTGKVIEQKAFDPFGKPENGASKKDTDTEAPTTTLGFQSARTDEATGRVMLGQRQYDPTTARFTTPDTYVSGMLDVGLGTDNLTGNRYLFAGANPLAFYEDGHGMFSRLKKIAKAAVPALQFVPIVSTAINVASAATGRNFYEGGRKMSGGERMMMLGGAAIGLIPGVGAAAKVGLAAAKGVGKARRTQKLEQAVTGSCPLRNSFATGTRVLMADGSAIAIEDVEVGDYVLAADEETGKRAGRRVEQTITGTGVKLLVDVLTVGDTDGALVATDGHPFLVAKRGWVLAANLHVGDQLVDADGNHQVIQALAFRTVAQARVHNLSIADFHTYFVVATQPVLVHNCGPALPPGKWMSVVNYADKEIQAVRNLFRTAEGATETGRHAKGLRLTAAELRKRAQNNGYLPEIRARLLKAADEIERKSRGGIDHRGGPKQGGKRR